MQYFVILIRDGVKVLNALGIRRSDAFAKRFYIKTGVFNQEAAGFYENARGQ